MKHDSDSEEQAQRASHSLTCTQILWNRTRWNNAINCCLGDQIETSHRIFQNRLFQRILLYRGVATRAPELGSIHNPQLK